MRFYPEFPGLLCDVQWYFVDEDTPDLGRRTVFGSLDWESDPKGGAPLGEVYGEARTWVNGGNPTSAKGEPPPCGTDHQWSAGDFGPPFPATPVDLWATPLCCARKSSPFTFQGCGDGRTPMWDTYTFETAGIGAGQDCALFNGRWTLRYISPCLWRTWTGGALPPSGSNGWQLTAGSGPNLGFSAESSLNYTGAVYHLSQPTDPESTLVATLLSHHVFCEVWPRTIVLYPGGIEMPLVGQVFWDAGTDAVPAFYLECNGQAVSRALYSLLWGRLGTSYGAGDGSTTFNLPDLRGRAPIGLSPGGLGGGRPSARAAGDSGGGESVTLVTGQLPAHNHPVTDPGHAHGPGSGATAFFVDAGTVFDIYNNAGGGTIYQRATTATATTGITTGNTGSAQAVPTQPPWLCLRALIYAGQ